MRKIGLTGSIASGKTLVTGILREVRDVGEYVIDADEISRDICRSGKSGAKAVARLFGEDFLDANGSVDRKKLGAVVFRDEKKRKSLEAALHPLILDEINAISRDYENQGALNLFIDAPLLIESGLYRECDEVWLVVCDDAKRMKRLMHRDGFDSDEAARRMASQMPQEEKKNYSDVIIDNSGSVDQTIAIVMDLLSARKMI